jgi:hypothetical protein
MNEFRIKNDGFKEVRKTIILKTIPMGLLAGGTGIFISLYNNPGMAGSGVLTEVILISLAAMAVGIFGAMRRSKKSFESYFLKVEHNRIVKKQFNLPEISIDFKDVTLITENLNGSITVRGRSSSDIIGIPGQIEEREKLIELLKGIKDISVPEGAQSLLQKYNLLFVLLPLGLMLIFYTSANKIITGVSGLLLLAGIVYGFISLQNNKQVDRFARNGRWLLVFVAFSVIMGLYFKLFLL